MRIPFMTVLALASAACAVAPPPPVASSAPPSIAVETLRDVTRTLSDDSFEGRAPGTPAEDRTVALIAERFARAGLKPGNGDSWFQAVPLVELTVDPAPTLRITGGGKPIDFAYRTDMVAGTYRVRPRVEVRGSDVVFVGYGINAPERGWNDYAGLDVRGKTVVILVNDPDWRAQGLDGPFDGRAMTYYGRWTYKYEEAARQGAAAAFVVHDTEPAAYPWSVVVSSWTGPQLNQDAADDHMDQTVVNGWLTRDAAARLLAAGGQDLAWLTAAAGVQGFKPVALGVKASIAIDSRIRRQASRNVVGVLPGKTRPDEYVLYSAHWDHLGRCEPAPDGDDICNGAIDNASGTAGLIALAEACGKAGAADRSIVFLAVTAEESGLLGSAYYADNPPYPLARTVGGVNIDGLNVHGRARDIIVIGAGKSELEDYLKRAAVDVGRTVEPEPTPERGYYYRSDHFSFAKRGVPMIYFESGDDLVEGGRAAGRAHADDYTRNRYHGPKDEYDPAWDWSGAIDDLGLYYRIGRELATGDAWPNWHPTSEFRAVRDASRGVK
jgi:Zn-dependent M28 family amino/carboxypeptidase